jgi:methylated-DNA-[protein]-cysteine S-methyltransferase
MNKASVFWHEIDTPIGRLLLAGEHERLQLIHFQNRSHAMCPEPGWIADASAFVTASAQLREYFAGRRREFDLALLMPGTAFQRAVWSTLRLIPYGTTISYAELARRVGKPRAVRAVGSANGSNPLPIVVPCHRVIGSDGSLTGFGGGLDLKHQLLSLEGAACVTYKAGDLFSSLAK